MIQLRDDITPKKAAIDKLAEYQKTVDDEGTFTKQSKKAKSSFSSRNKKGNSTFDEVKRCLTLMCDDTRSCVYCEVSVGDEVEHIYPKDLYPDKAFVWENYVYACGPCNGPKSNKFAIFKSGEDDYTVVNPPRGTAASKPPAGDPALINPREENPLDFAILDLSGTFKFLPYRNLSDKDKKRMDYTYNEILRLNDAEREFIRQARENAFGNYKSRLFMYDAKKKAGVAQTILDTMIKELKKESHKTVWQEMQRYYNEGFLTAVDSELNDLFAANTEALDW